jgi:hypothetical protein
MLPPAAVTAIVQAGGTELPAPRPDRQASRFALNFANMLYIM